MAANRFAFKSEPPASQIPTSFAVCPGMLMGNASAVYQAAYAAAVQQTAHAVELRRWRELLERAFNSRN